MPSEHTPIMSVEQYLELEENSPDTRYEYFDGYVYIMSGGSANYAASGFMKLMKLRMRLSLLRLICDSLSRMIMKM